MFISVFGSGTAVQRLTKAARGRVDGVLYTAYSQLEQTEPGFIRRKFYITSVDQLKAAVEALDEKVQPTWLKIWERPDSNQAFVSGLFQAWVGDDPLRPELNLSNMTGETVDVFMVWVSATNKAMKKIKEIADRAVPNWHIKILNGDHTSNRDAEYETIKELNEAKIAGKRGVIIISNQMGSRSYGVPAIQANVIAYDRGSTDATAQKASRPLTPPKAEKPMYDGSLNKQYGHIVEMSFDPNRSENIEKLILDEAIMVSRSEGIPFAAGLKYVLTSVNVLKHDEFGHFVEVTESDMFKVYSDNDTMLRVADMTPDIELALDPQILSILSRVNTDGKSRGNDRRTVVGEGAVTSVRKGPKKDKAPITDAERRELEKMLNSAIRSLNMSATTVYDLADGGESYSGCLKRIAKKPLLSTRFESLYGITVEETQTLLDLGFLNNEAILDVIVQNSKLIDTPFV